MDKLQQMSKMRQDVLNILLSATALLGTVGIIYIYVRAAMNGIQGVNIWIYSLAYLGTMLLFFARGIDYRTRAFFFLALMYGFAAFAFYAGWLVSGGRVFLLAFIVGAAVLLDMRAGIWAVVLSLLTYVVFGTAYYLGWLKLGQLPSPVTASPIIIEGVGFAISLGITSIGLWFAGRILAFAITAIQEAQHSRGLLEQRAEELKDTNRLLAERSASAELARYEAEAARQTIEAEAWQSSTLAALSQVMSGESDMATLASSVIHQLCQALNAPVGGLFILENGVLRLLGSYAFTSRKRPVSHFLVGEGLVGQAALERKSFVVTRVPSDYLAILSGTTQIVPAQVYIAPILFEEQLIGVVELGLLHPLAAGRVEYLSRILQNVGVAFHTARTRAQVNELLEQTQEQAASLRAREDALKTINEELRAQSESLQGSQDQLRRQQSVLEEANAELTEQRSVLDQQNRELKQTQQDLEAKTEELAQANRYKSEFLANMSHELRTPLNSLLILSRMFANNSEGNLTSEQVESANVIFKSGSDLLSIINEILDLSKVEAGRMVFHFAPCRLEDLVQNMHSQFDYLALEKGLVFEITRTPDLPASIETDQQRVEQIIKNLLSNAFKFTEKGAIQLIFELSGNMLAIRVVDSGIGMTVEQQSRVFEAFQQADGSTNRRYGGTGLGLTISRELATRLGGSIGLESEYGKGSTFTLYLPMVKAGQGQYLDSQPTPETISAEPPRPPAALPTVQKPVPASSLFADDREALQNGDKVLLIIEDDPQFAKVVFDFAHAKGFCCLVAGDGENGLELARRYHPDAILLDLRLPGVNGWDVLDALKQSPDLRHIAVHILSASDETLDVYKHGAMGFLQKPVTPDGLEAVFQNIGEFIARDIKNLLIVEDDAGMRHSVRQLLSGRDVKISEASSGAQALELLRAQRFECMILDLTLPDMSGYDLLNRLKLEPGITRCPVIIYTGKALSEAENNELMKYAQSVIIKGVKSPERLLDETALFLHRVVADMPEEKQRTIKRLHDRESVFSGKHVLVVDDDMRNAFALSRLLSEKGLKVSIARSGSKALEILDQPGDPRAAIDLVLMDMMMPEMDGYETMQRIRAQVRYRNLPILALTARAMKGDHEKCISAGANDYLSKPVDADQLFSMLRVWLYR